MPDEPEGTDVDFVELGTCVLGVDGLCVGVVKLDVPGVLTGGTGSTDLAGSPLCSPTLPPSEVMDFHEPLLSLYLYDLPVEKSVMVAPLRYIV